MDCGEARIQNRVSSIARDSQAARLVRARMYQENLDSAALAKKHYEAAKMEATVKAFVDGSKSKADVQKYMSEEARLNAVRERAERERRQAQQEQRVCRIAVGLAFASVMLALFFMVYLR